MMLYFENTVSIASDLYKCSWLVEWTQKTNIGNWTVNDVKKSYMTTVWKNLILKRLSMVW